MTSKRGSRPGPKPKPIGTTKQRHNVMLTREVAEVARQIGYGNLSAGLEIAVKRHAHFIRPEITPDKTD